MVADCVFCRIIEGSIPANLVHQDDEFVAFPDIQPHAKRHFLVVPRRHVASLTEAFPTEASGDAALMGRLLEVGTRVAREQGLLPGGFRSVINTGPHAGQTVFHVHLHVIGGEPLRGGFGA
jgi:histidine triad (HIT) family protein